MALTLDSLDDQLQEWRDRLDRVNQNLLDFYGLLTYQRLCGGGSLPPTPLKGTTQAQVEPVLADLEALFQHRGLLADVVDQAAGLRQQLPRKLRSDDKLQDIDLLLNGPSIRLPLVAIPLAQRSLLSATNTAQTVTPEELLRMMVDAFERARDVVLMLDRVWGDLEPRLLALTQELNRLRSQVSMEISEYGVAAHRLPTAAIAQLETLLQKLQTQIDGDPLAVDGQFEQIIWPHLKQLAAQVAQFQDQRDRLQSSLQFCQDLLAQIQTTQAKLMAIAQESAEKVTPPPGPPLPDPQAAATLADWLQRLRSRQGEAQAVAVGIERWTTQAQTLLPQLQQALIAHQQALALRQELRGRLEALQAKALAKGVVEDPSLVELAGQAKALLYSRPTPLQAAQATMGQYEQRLNQRNTS
jgi:hypothetical protein